MLPLIPTTNLLIQRVRLPAGTYQGLWERDCITIPFEPESILVRTCEPSPTTTTTPVVVRVNEDGDLSVQLGVIKTLRDSTRQLLQSHPEIFNFYDESLN